MERCQVLSRKHFGRSGSKSSDYFEIAPSRVAHLYMHFCLEVFRKHVALCLVVIVSSCTASTSSSRSRLCRSGSPAPFRVGLCRGERHRRNAEIGITEERQDGFVNLCRIFQVRRLLRQRAQSPDDGIGGAYCFSWYSHSRTVLARIQSSLYLSSPDHADADNE
jgi:hypothetical protein